MKTSTRYILGVFSSAFVMALLLSWAPHAANAQQGPPASEQVKKIEALVNKAAALIDSKGKAAFAGSVKHIYLH